MPQVSEAVQTASLTAGVLRGERRALAKAITLVESTRPDHQRQAADVLSALMPHSGRALRIGITGVPGVGKSTFIEALGLYLIAQGHRVAVLAVDPSSSIGGGSILGDKTRMEALSRESGAFIRPSPSAGALGGVAAKTRETMLLCEAAGYDVVIVETVGVGQSETLVAGMTDCFVLLLLPHAGDDLQAIKKGIMELADIVVFNKADVDDIAANTARVQMQMALRLLNPATEGWKPPVLRLSARVAAQDPSHLEAFWQHMLAFQKTTTANGQWQTKRKRQSRDWMWQLIQEGLRHRFRADPRIAARLPDILADVEEARVSPARAAQDLLGLLDESELV
jgi:LAO/AO transport system kinase